MATATAKVRATRAYVGLGSNLAVPARQIASALHRLASWPGVHRMRASRLYRTSPWGRADQPPFVNAVAELTYVADAATLLDGLLSIEREAGRVRDVERWGPRVLDLDLLLFGDRRIDTPGLHVPHPRIAQRAFVLMPLAELAPALRIPDLGPIADLVRDIDAAQATALD